MMNIQAAQAEIKRAILKSFYSHEDHHMAYSKDHFDKYKHEGCWELHRRQLKFYESDNPENSTTTTVVSVEKRRGTNMLILRCGPGGRMIFFLEFDSKSLTDEWQEALCSFTGQKYLPNPFLRRSKSAREIAKKAKEMKQRRRTALPDINDDEQADSDTEQEHQESAEAPAETQPEAPNKAPSEGSSVASPEVPPEALTESRPEVRPDAPPETPAEALPEGSPEAPTEAPASPPASGNSECEHVPSYNSETSDDSEPASRPLSLRSRDADTSPTLEDLAKSSAEQECFTADLQQLQIMDYRSNVIVKEPLISCHLHLGDSIEVKNTDGHPMKAEELTEHIRTTTEDSMKLAVKRTPVCTVRKQQQELVINIKASETVRPNSVDAIMNACTSPCTLPDAAGSENSNLTITEINGNPLDSHSQPDQISEKMKESLVSSGGFLTLRLVPQSLLDAVAEEEQKVHAEDKDT